MASCTGPVLLIVILGILPKAKKLLLKTLAYPRQSLAILKEGLNYSKWVALSSTAYIAMPYAVRFILATCASLKEVGIFSAGMTFALVFTTLNTVVRAVLFPQVTAFEETERIKLYLKKLREVTPYYTVIATAGIVMLALLQWFVLGEEYRAAMPVFLVTAGSWAFVILLGLGTMLVHTLMRPYIDALVNVGRLCSVIGLALFLIPKFNALGAAVSYATPLLIGEIYMLWYVYQKISTNGKK